MQIRNNFIAAALSISNARHNITLVGESAKNHTIEEIQLLYIQNIDGFLVVSGQKEFIDPETLRLKALENMSDIYSFIEQQALNETDKSFIDINFNWIANNNYIDFQSLLNRTSNIKTFLGVG